MRRERNRRNGGRKSSILLNRNQIITQTEQQSRRLCASPPPPAMGQIRLFLLICSQNVPNDASDRVWQSCPKLGKANPFDTDRRDRSERERQGLVKVWSFLSLDSAVK